MQKTLVLSKNFSAALDFWNTIRVVVLKAKNIRYDFWFMNLNGSNLVNADNWVLWIKEICFELVGTPLDQQFVRKNLVHHAMENTENDNEKKEVATTASHSVEVALQYYVFIDNKKNSTIRNQVINRSFEMDDVLNFDK